MGLEDSVSFSADLLVAVLVLIIIVVVIIIIIFTGSSSLTMSQQFHQLNIWCQETPWVLHCILVPEPSS